jgi:hypothetical protein
MRRMAEDQLRTAFEAIHAKFQDELDALRRALEAQQTKAVEEARRHADAAAEAQWSAKIDALRAEAATAATRAREEHDRALAAERQQLEAARLETRQHAETTSRAEQDRARELDTARAELADARRKSETASAELDAMRRELETARAERTALTAAREEATSALLTERERAASEIEASRQRAVALEHARAQLQVTLIADRDQALQKANALYERDTAAAVTEARAQERQAQLAIVERLLEAVKALDSARTLSETLTALVTAIRPHAPRSAVFIVDRDQLQPWKAVGFENLGPQPFSASDDGLLARAVRNAEPVSTAVTSAPSFASLPSGRAALAVPIIVGGQAVAVLYADDGGAQPSQAPASWPEAVQILGRHASMCLAHLTAVRTVQAARFAVTPKAQPAVPSVTPSVAPPRSQQQTAAAPVSDEESSARRYARLLVSEIKLYNESAVRLGRERRDLLTRLGAEIERAQRLYEERVPSSIGARSQYFHQELVQTLADGDPGLLGSSARHR